MAPSKVIRVEVPDAHRGVGLEQRLSGSELTGSDPEGWAVVGAAAAYLLSEEARNVTGTTLYVDSGYHAMGM